MPFVPPTGIDSLIAQLSEVTRAQATEDLAKIGAPAIPYLVAAAQGTWKNGWGVTCENDMQIRCGAVISLRKMGPAASTALPALVELLTFDFATLRRELVVAFAAIKEGNPDSAVVARCEAALERLEKDPDYEVRFEAVHALRGMEAVMDARRRRIF